MNRRKAVLYILIAVLVICLQAFWNKIGGVFGVCPEGCIAFLCALLPFSGWWGFAFAAVLGILMDIQLGPVFAFHLVVYLICALIAMLTFKRDGAVILKTVAAAFMNTAVRWGAGLFIAFIRDYPIDFYAGFIRQYLPMSVLTALLAALFAFVLLRIDDAQWLQMEEQDLQINE